MIVRGAPRVDYNIKKNTVGVYAQIYEGTMNNMRLRAIGAIALRTSIDYRSFYFISLQIGKIINSN